MKVSILKEKEEMQEMLNLKTNEFIMDPVHNYIKSKVNLNDELMYLT